MLHQYRICAAFAYSTAASVRARPSSSSVSTIVSVYRRSVAVRPPFPRSTRSAGSAAGVEAEVAGVVVVGGATRLSPEERAAVRAERRKKREEARQARILNVGR